MKQLKGTHGDLAKKITDILVDKIDFAFISDPDLREKQRQKTRDAVYETYQIIAKEFIEHFIDNVGFVGATSNGSTLEEVSIT